MSKEAIHYCITPSHPEAHIFTIICKVETPNPDGQQFQLPNWIPGSYMIRDFSKNIIQLTAKDHLGTELSIKKLNKSLWQVAACSGSITIEYDVYAWDLSVRSAHLDTTHGFFNGTSVFMEVVEQAQNPCTVEIKKPSGSQYDNWRIATSLETFEKELYLFGLYKAKNYDDLIDHPVEMGCFDLGSFTVNNIQHDIVLTGKHRADMQQLCNDLKVICQTHVDFFGELPADVKRYVFLTMVVGEGYGGLEHRSSTSLLCSRNDLPLKEQEQTKEYRDFLGLCSHEYFHTWNIKRIKPDVYLPYNLNEEVYTEQLWAFEGITSYYDDLSLARNKTLTPEAYLEVLGKTITRVLRGCGRHKQSVADSSFDTWTRFYKQDESAPNNIVSYYAKGTLIALGLDFTIRKATNNNKSLDDVMHVLWNDYGKKNIGVPEKQIEKIATEIAGQDLQEFFDLYLYGTEDVPLQNYLSSVGIEIKSYLSDSVDNTGGVKNTNSVTEFTTLGARIIADPVGAKLTHVFDKSNAQNAGLSAGDIIIAVDNLKVTKSNIEKIIKSYPIDTQVTVHAFRRDELMAFDLKLAKTENETFYLEFTDNPNESTLQNRSAWLGN